MKHDGIIEFWKYNAKSLPVDILALVSCVLELSIAMHNDSDCTQVDESDVVNRLIHFIIFVDISIGSIKHFFLFFTKIYSLLEQLGDFSIRVPWSCTHPIKVEFLLDFPQKQGKSRRKSILHCTTLFLTQDINSFPVNVLEKWLQSGLMSICIEIIITIPMLFSYSLVGFHSLT